MSRQIRTSAKAVIIQNGKLLAIKLKKWLSQSHWL